MSRRAVGKRARATRTVLVSAIPEEGTFSVVVHAPRGSPPDWWERFHRYCALDRRECDAGPCARCGIDVLLLRIPAPSVEPLCFPCWSMSAL